MAKSEIFVGRQDELKEFAKVLENQRGQAIIVVGNRGMGKTWLVNRMAKLASEHPTLKCGWVRYEVTPTDSPDSTMTTMMDNAFEAANKERVVLTMFRKETRHWLAMFEVFARVESIWLNLILSLRRDPAKDTRQQFLERLELISKRMPENGRAIFIVDPEKYMAEKSDQTWAIVVEEFAGEDKVYFCTADGGCSGRQRSYRIGLDNVVRIPSKTLDALSEEDVDELMNCRRAI